MFTRHGLCGTIPDEVRAMVTELKHEAALSLRNGQCNITLTMQREIGLAAQGVDRFYTQAYLVTQVVQDGDMSLSDMASNTSTGSVEPTVISALNPKVNNQEP